MKSGVKLALLLVCVILSGCKSQTESVSIADKQVEVLNEDGTYSTLIISDTFSLDKLGGCRMTYDRIGSLVKYVSTSPMFLAFGDGHSYAVYGAHPRGTSKYNTISYEKLTHENVLLEVRDGKLVYTYDLPEYDNSTVFSIGIVRDKNSMVLGFMLTQAEKEEV